MLLNFSTVELLSFADSWALRFIPKENGIHQIHLRHNGTHIPQSPFRIVIGHDDADPAAVQASGNGLRDIKCGKFCHFLDLLYSLRFTSYSRKIEFLRYSIDHK